MSHRNNDNNGPWNNRNPRNNNNNNDCGGGGNYKDRGWVGNNRYGSDNRYNKDRRNYRGYGGGGGGGGGRRNNYDGRPYRNNSAGWGNNGGMLDGNYPRYQNNWHPKHSGNNKQGGGFGPELDVMPPQIPPPPIVDFEVETDERRSQRGETGGSAGNATGGGNSANGSGVDSKFWGNDDFGSPGDGFQGFADVDFAKTSNGASTADRVDFPSKLSAEKDEKGDISIQENEFSKMIVDEAMKIISDAEQPSCSSAPPSNPSDDANAPVATSTTSNPITERRASIERSAEQVTRKLINQLTSMNKHSLKQMINNPDSKYETALKTHARQKLRAEVRRQLRNFNLNESADQPKTTCSSMLEPDESVDSDKIPDALLEQIGKVLDLNLLDLNVTAEDPVPAPEATVGDEDVGVINTSDADYSATEVLDKNLQLTDEDGQFDTDDLFARAELLLMKGSESVRQGNSSGPSSPTDEMFPNEQIDSIVSEDNGFDPDDESDSEQIERMLDEPLHAAFPCFLRVSTVEELNKKVDTLPVPVTEESAVCAVEAAVPLLPSPELVDDSSVSNLPTSEEQIPPVPAQTEEQPVPPSFEIIAEANIVSLVEENSLPTKEEPVLEVPVTPAPEIEVTPEPVTEKPVEMPIETVPKLEIAPPMASPLKNPTPEPSSGTIRAPTHPELAARKPKGSKTYKPNLVQHESSKRDGSSNKSSSASPSQTTSSSGHVSSPSRSKTPSKSGSGTNLNNVPKPITKNQNTTNNNATSNKSNNTTNNSGSTRGRSRVRRDVTGTKENTAQPNGSASPAGGNSTHKNSNNGSTPETHLINDSRPATQPPQPVEPQPQPPATSRSVRAKTPGPALAGGPQDHSSPLGVKKKKKKRNKRKDRSPPPDSGMMLECDLRISRPAVTPTPPPVSARDAPQTKKSTESDRSSSSTKLSREMRAKSADPKLYYESKKDRDRNKDRGRNRDEDKKSRSKEDKKDQEREDRKEKELRREKENESASATSVASELSVSKPDRGSERKKSPVPKPATAAKLPVDTPKHSKDEHKEIPKDAVKEREKETPKEIANKESTKEVIKESKWKETDDASKEKEASVVAECKEDKDVGDLPKEKESTDVTDGPSKPPKPHKKKKSLLRGPNLIKGRREVIPEPETQVPSQQKDSDEVEVVEQTSQPPEPNQSISDTPSHCHSRQREAPPAAVALSPPTVPAPLEHHTLMITSATSLTQRTASPRPWKSPGEKKLIPPSLPALITHPMSPPSVERVRQTPTPTPSSPVRSPEPPQQRIHLVASPVLMSQPEVLAGRIPLQTTIAPLVASASAVPQINTFAPVMALLNQMQDIDNRMSDFQRRKMQIDSEMMRLNSEKFQIDQNSMQLQNERFMLLNSLRAALVECELTTLATMQQRSVAHIPAVITSPTTVVGHRRRNPEPPTDQDPAPKSKRRKEAPEVSNPPVSTTVSSLSTDLSESEESANPCTASGGERTIRRITKISGNTEILKLFQRRRLISDRSAEESQSEDNSAPQVASSSKGAPVPAETSEKPNPAKRRRTRTYGGSDQSEPSTTGARLRSDSTKSVESVKPIEIADQPSSSAQVGPAPAGTNSQFKKDAEIPLVAASRRLLPREVKVVLSKLNVASKRRGGNGT